MSSADPTLRVTVPGQRAGLAPVTRAQVRALKRHLLDALRDLRAARRPERLIQRRAAEPKGFVAQVVAAGCRHCRGSCCMAGGTHAFIDERTLARVRAEQPGLTVRGIIRAYVDAVAPEAYQGSCVFHGAQGCTLPRPLRAELCNAYYCDGLARLLKDGAAHARTVAIATHDGEVMLVHRHE